MLQTSAWEPFGLPPNVIRWVTQSEEDNFGYDIYRGLSKSGPFERINEHSILGAGTTDLPQHYKYSDASIESGMVYWYYVGSISLTGERSRLTPVYPSKSKSAWF
ncbi:MAG: hypothetical protein ACJAYC_003634 [Halieaceae bacterium]|jgi:hypothetical protein